MSTPRGGGFPHEYAAYGLTVRSNRPLPGFAPAHERAPAVTAVTVDFAGAHDADRGDAAPPPFHHVGMETLWHRPGGAWRLRYVDPRDGAFWTIDLDAGGTRLVVRWSADSLLDDIPAILSGTGLAAALHLRGVPLLHAAVTAIDGGAVAVLGEPGAGKSTTAAALVARGFASMSDDVAALDLGASPPRVHAGPVRLRVFAESARAAGFAAGDLPRVFADDVLGPKRYIPLSADDGSFHAGALPLRAAYFLHPRAPGAGPPTIEPVPARRALPLLLRNLYAARFLDAAQRGALLRALADVAATVPVRAVRAHDDLSALPALVDAIAADAIAAAPPVAG